MRLIKQRVCSTTSGCHSLYSSLHPETAIHASCQFSPFLSISHTPLHPRLTHPPFSPSHRRSSVFIFCFPPSFLFFFLVIWDWFKTFFVIIALTNHIVIASDTNLIMIHGSFNLDQFFSPPISKHVLISKKNEESHQSQISC